MTDADAVSVPRELLRILLRHPRQLPERLILFAVRRLGAPTRAWAEEVRARAGADAAGGPAAGADAAAGEADIAARCAATVHETITTSRVDGAVAGTPFFIALVPAYVTFLWTQARMVLRIAALQGRDTADEAIAAELLALRGIHRSVDEATAALARLDEEAPAPGGWRERIVSWVALVRRILVLAAFVGPDSPEGDRPSRARQLLFAGLGLLIWAGTWIFPVSFMVVMAWGCDSSTRQLGAVALDYYGVGRAGEGGGAGEGSLAGGASARPPAGRLERARRHLARVREPRRLLWSAAIGLSVLGPLVLIALAVSKRAHHGPWVTLLAPIVGLALVLALAARQRT